MFVALRDIRFARGRFALMGSVVALITTLVVFLHGLTGGLAREASSAVAELPAQRIVFGAPAGASPQVSFGNSTVDEQQSAAWRGAPGVRSAEPLGVAMTRLTAHGSATSVSVFGTSEALLPPLAAGAAPGDGRVAVGERTAREAGLRVGDRVTLGTREVTVSGLTADRGYGHAPSVWTTLATWSEVSHQRQPSALAVTGGGSPAGEAARTTKAVGVQDALDGIDGYAAEHGTLSLLQGFLFVVSALVVGAFFTVWTVQRRPDIAVLKAVGASSGYLVRDALAQALAVLAAGTVLGGAAGALGGGLASSAVPFELGAATVAVPVAAMVLLGLAGSALAVRRITSVDPLTALGAQR
ncbi:putative ABC transport system permease protein [Streptomyces olivoverticillatus]|uniref:Putative ABC transport system permease protein n=1 Tax=Streptomyces olivoverticillatus TaxID=66427 RepID=A0A7W7LT94_9ACTN|nr:ABC transporter permease [Streptomyces olivoverticillatus]MBB4895657.1 putative ABC transport system permease protein [Streptomyces olivoverticillatus]